MTAEQVLFYVFGGIAVGGALGVVFLRRVVYSAVSLMISLFGVAALFMLLEAPFLAAAQVLLYIGGIAVLILFGIVVAQQREDRPLTDRSAQAPLAALVIAIIVFWMARTVLQVNWESAKEASVRSAAEARSYAQIIPDPQSAATLSKVSQPEFIGYSLSRTYVLPFEISSLLLLLALLGAIMMLRRYEEEERGESPPVAEDMAPGDRMPPAESPEPSLPQTTPPGVNP
ncbi:MAG: NADH-quinone oxidoreductase subunit J family protein [bacterium JZ-2024 1]